MSITSAAPTGTPAIPSGTLAVATAPPFGPLPTVDGRLRFLDLARGIAIVVMVLQHVQLLFAVDHGETSLVGATFLVLGTAPAAPVFMVSMGFLFGASRRTGVRSGLRRGLALFALGYALNLLRFTLPGLAGDGVKLEELLGGPWQALLEIDILQLAGLSLIVLGGVKRLVRGPWPVVALAAAAAAVAPLLWGAGSGSPVLDPLWGAEEYVSFPLFPWLAYPLLGLALARFAQRAARAGALLRDWAAAGLACLVAGSCLIALFPDASGVLAVGDYFRSGLPVQLVLAGFVLVWLPVLWWLDRRLSWRSVPRYLTSLSRHLTVIYLVQWLLIGWMALALGVVDQPSWLAALLAVPVLAASHLLALAYDRLVGRPWRERRSLRRVLAEARRGA
jgi:surface polysaccharide O-acyltransferase-like enzyme